jgi:hypothetical protein
MKRTRKFLKPIAAFVLVNMLSQFLLPFIAHALTSGPSQPEFSSFEPANTTQMVDLFSGDFNYNIPLLDVEGYPINISYHSGITMDQEASWVGLGWNINPGVINRTMRGLPDDFKSDQVQTEYNIKDNTTWGCKIGGGVEAFGNEDGDAIIGAGLGGTLGINYNNYRGVSIEYSVNPSISAGYGNKSLLTLNLGLGYSSQSGLSPTGGLNAHYGSALTDERSLGGNFGVSYSSNSRAGLQQLSFGGGLSYSKSYTDTKSDGDKNSDGYGVNGGSSISFSKPCFVPQISYPMNNFGYSVKAKAGYHWNWTFFNGMTEFYYSSQSLIQQQKTTNAFGYMYLGAASTNDALDFNREKDGDVSLTRPNLPVTNLTYDIYSVSGQGVGGMYRPYRNDIGSVYDPYVENTGDNTAGGAEAGLGNLVHAGVNMNYTSSISHSGKWVNNNLANDHLSFHASDDAATYFKQAGEKVQSHQIFDTLYEAKQDAYYLHLNGKGKDAALTTSVYNQLKSRKTDLGGAANRFRAKRNQLLSVLTNSETSQLYSDTIESYPVKKLLSQASPTKLHRSAYPNHHIGEITNLRADGARYVYGIPVYNISQDEVGFNISGRPDSLGYVRYGNAPFAFGLGTTKDDSKDNVRGKDHYYRKTSLPKYAYSYLLTKVLSADYVDVLGDGITPDDLGTAVKFNYSKIYGQDIASTNYRWRTPYGKGGNATKGLANHDEGFKSVTNDDKANYIYGEKEMWYMHSVVTKNYVAQFYLSKRNDGLGVKGSYGGQDTSQRIMKLDSIVLYSRTDLVLHGKKATRIKGVHFEYDYSLCPGVDNNSTGAGKLTLKRLYFTYANAGKGKFSPYTFEYSSVNYSYDFTARDRWGNYKPNGTVPNKEFPYTDQSNIDPVTHRNLTADHDASLWTLTKINLPSGGAINVDYEADDYSDVQDKTAMQMFKLIGVGSSLDDAKAHNDYLYRNSGNFITSSYSNQNYLFFHLPTAMTSDQVSKLFMDNNFGHYSRIYYKCMTHVNNHSNWNDFDYVPGFADVEDYGIVPLPESPGLSNIAFVKLKEAPLEDGDGGLGKIQAITKAAMQYAKVNFPAKVYPGSDDDGKSGSFDFLTGIYDEVLKSAEGFYASLLSRQYCERITLDHSWIRLNAPFFTKTGGGSRVKRIRLSDNWASLEPGSSGTMSYGQEFEYTGNSKISSGTATWEPQIGSDENPFYDIKVYPDEKVGAVSDFHQVIMPMGESFAPSPSVGYAQVKVTDLQHSGDPGNGYAIHKFWTAASFPIVFNETPIDIGHEKDEPDLLESFLGSSHSEEDLIMSQGYTVVLNDMHGKPQSTEIYNNGGDMVSSVTYYYNQKSGALDNNVRTIDRFGTISKQDLGIDVDVVADTREHYSDIEADNLGINLDLSIIQAPVPIPVPIPSGWPQHTSEETTCRTAVLTRVVNQYGLIDSVVARDEHSHISSRNLAYDPETGEVLVTKTQNLFNDPVYSFTYPAHWAYEGMGPAYKNIGLEYDHVKITKGIPYIGRTPIKYTLVSGDELLLFNTTVSPHRIWVYKPSVKAGYSLIEKDGSLVDGIADASIKVVRSGRRNMASTPIGTVTTLINNPVWNGTKVDISNILQTAASEYSDQWQMYICGKDKNGSICTNNQLASVINPFIKGVKGIWRKKKDYVYMDERRQDPVHAYPRSDGAFKTWWPFWQFNTAGVGYVLPNGDTSKHWTWTNQVSKFSPYGFEIENKDALNNYTSALYGYNNSFPSAVASNSAYNDMIFDGFEDYASDKIGITNPLACFRSPHWDLSRNFKIPGQRPPGIPSPVLYSDTVKSYHHTGKYSLWIKGGMGDTIDVKVNNCPASDVQGDFPQYFIKSTDCITGLSPDTGKYVLSMWVRKDTDCTVFNYTGVQAKLAFGGAGSYNVTFKPSGNIINGWQKIEGEFKIPYTASIMWIILSKYGLGHDAYFDDMRIHPFHSNMKSFVYDPVTLRLTAELDANNYATFYEYDEEGKLTRVKRETEKGIMTIKESRMNEHRIR